MNKIYKQRGLTLLEIMLSMAIVSGMAVGEFRQKLLEYEHQNAKQLGVEIFQYNNAVRRYLATHQIPAGSTEETIVKNGVNWLKSTKCGGTAGDEGFIGCNFSETTRLGKLHYVTEITAKKVTTPGNATRLVKSAKTIAYPTQRMSDGTPLRAVPVKGSSREDLAGIAALVASGGALAANAHGPGEIGAGMNSDGYALYCTYFLDPTVVRDECKGSINSENGRIDVNGHITTFVSNNATNDIWIRQDGGNKMKANFDFDVTQNLAMRGVSAIVPKNNEITFTDKDDLSVGSYIKVNGNLRFLDKVSFDNHTGINGKMTVNGETVFKNIANFYEPASFHKRVRLNSISYLEDVARAKFRAGANADTVTAEFDGKAKFDGKVDFHDPVRFYDDVTFFKNYTANKDLTVKGILRAQGLNNKLDDKLYSIESLNGIRSKTKVVAPKFTDIQTDNPAYYVSPSQKSVVADVEADNVESDYVASGTFRFIDPSKSDSSPHWGLDKDATLRYYNNAGHSGYSTELSLRDGLVHNSGTVASGSYIDKPKCQGGYNAHIDTALSQITSQTGKPIASNAIQTYAENASGNRWRIRLRYYGPKSDGTTDWIYPTGVYGKVFIMTRCVQ